MTIAKNEIRRGFPNQHYLPIINVHVQRNDIIITTLLCIPIEYWNFVSEL